MRRRYTGVALATLLPGFAACAPKLENWASDYPEGALRVRYEPATRFSSCLSASVAMAAEYVDKRPFSEPGVRRGLHDAKLDETRPDDLARWLRTQRLDMIVLAGEFHDRAPVGLRWWVMQRGYPVICVINRKGDDPQYNHAVVVIGMKSNATEGAGPTDTVYYLDPSSTHGLETVDAEAFETWWTRGRRTMMIVVRPPPDAGTRRIGEAIRPAKE